MGQTIKMNYTSWLTRGMIAPKDGKLTSDNKNYKKYGRTSTLYITDAGIREVRY